MIPANTRIRLAGDPSRRGHVTGKTRPGRRGVGLRYQIIFPDTTTWIPEDQLEVISDRESPIDLLSRGKLLRAIDLRRVLTHVRLTGRLADVIYSMEATNTDFYPYQFKPVVRFLLSPSNALLIADEVGLGKTIEAGLIWTELRSRFDLRRLLILCPAILKEKWQRELADKIGVKADIVDAARLKSILENVNQSSNGFAVICSVQGARPHKDWETTDSPNAPAELARYLKSMKEEEKLVDLLVVDEAHYLRNSESQTFKAGKLFRDVAENLLMLSATPIHNKNEDLFSLLRLLDAETFERPEDLAQILDASRPLIAARDEILGPSPDRDIVLQLLHEASLHPLLRGSRQLESALNTVNQLNPLADRDDRSLLARKLEMINPLAYVITRTRKRDIKEWRVIREPTPEKVPMSSDEETFYQKVTNFVIDYAMNRDVSDQFILSTPQRQMCSSMAATLAAWNRRRDNVDEQIAATGTTNNTSAIGPLTQELLDNVQNFGDVDELRKCDSKYNRVSEVLKEYFSHHPDEKVVLFSTFRETLNYLAERLEEDKIPNVLLHGGISDSKESALESFREDPEIRVLLSSEVGSEGIDLQFCRVLVNYDLPWNPMRVEQRIGRLDRLGQEADKILIWNLFYDETIDSRIYDRLYDKLNLCREALGDFDSVLGEEIRKLTFGLLSNRLTPRQQEQRIDQTAQALANIKQEHGDLEAEATHLVAYGDYILNEVKAAKELNRWITAEDLKSYVIDFFQTHYNGCNFKQLDEDSDVFDVQLSNTAKEDLEAFVREEKLAQSSLTKNHSSPVRCIFQNRASPKISGRAEIISQFHPLVRFVSRSINDKEEQVYPAVAIRLDSSDCDASVFPSGRYVLAAQRWSVNGLQSIEKLAYTGACINDQPVMLTDEESERLASLCAKYGRDWFEGSKECDLESIVEITDQTLFARLDDEYEDYVEDLRSQNEDRADLQLKNLRRYRKKELLMLEEVLEKHKSNQRDSLVKATEGRISKLESRIERKSSIIEKRRAISHRKDEVLIALIDINHYSILETS